MAIFPFLCPSWGNVHNKISRRSRPPSPPVDTLLEPPSPSIASTPSLRLYSLPRRCRTIGPNKIELPVDSLPTRSPSSTCPVRANTSIPLVSDLNLKQMYVVEILFRWKCGCLCIVCRECIGCQCFCGTLINFHFVKFLEPICPIFSKGHAKILYFVFSL